MEGKVAEAQQREGLTSDRATELQKRFEQQTAETQHWKAKAEVLISQMSFSGAHLVTHASHPSG